MFQLINPESGSVSVQILIAADGGARIRLDGAGGARRVTIGTSTDEEGVLVVFDEDDRPRGTITGTPVTPSDENGSASAVGASMGRRSLAA
ncbi:MAG: hypothetical protein ACK47B_27160 [Armatimonadota bacterium]